MRKPLSQYYWGAVIFKIYRAKQKYRGMFETKTISGEIGLDIRTHAIIMPKNGKVVLVLEGGIDRKYRTKDNSEEETGSFPKQTGIMKLIWNPNMSSKDDSKQTGHENDTDVHVYAECFQKF